MLGVVDNPVVTAADDVMQQVADDMGVGDTWHPTPVGVFFGGPGQTHSEEVADPYFGGAGPARRPCRNCGECMTGCRHNSKNTLAKNYLYLAESRGAQGGDERDEREQREDECAAGPRPQRGDRRADEHR